MLFRLSLALCGIVSSAAAATPELLNLLPPDSKVVAGIDVAAVRATPFGDYAISRLEPRGHDFDAFAAATGFDPRSHLIEVVLGGNGIGWESEGVLAVRGRFNGARIVEEARSRGATVEEYQGVPTITAAGEGGRSAAIPSADLVLFGRRKLLRAAIDRLEAGSELAAETEAKVSSLSAGKHGWLLLLASPAELAGQMPDGAINGAMHGDIVKAIQEMSGSVAFGADVDLAGEAVTETPKDAEALANVVKFLLGMAQLTDNQELAAIVARLMAGLQITVAGNRLHIAATVPEADFEKMIETLHHVQHGP